MPDDNGPHRTGLSRLPDDLVQRRSALASKLSKIDAEGAFAEEKSRRSTMHGVGYALRLSSEFIAGVLVGAGLGYLIDRFAGTGPWGMIIFLLLGFVAGVLNVLRSAGLITAPQPGNRRRDAQDQ